jgi:glycine oxidase
MSKTLGIAGAGIAGRLLALEMHQRGWTVTLFDRDAADGHNSCTWTGAGMLAPCCELETAELEVARLGQDGIARWPALLARLAKPVFFQQRGSVVVAHPSDQGELNRLHQSIQDKLGTPIPRLTREQLAELEPEIAPRFATGLHFPDEGQLDNRELLEALGETLRRDQVTWHSGTEVTAVAPGLITTAAGTTHFDAVADCRGLGARPDLPNLRGIRGELIYVRAPDVTLNRPVRLMHPRYPLYIVPRPDHVFVIGATKIESDDLSPVSVRSALELLTAAYSVQPAFSEGRILDLTVNCRPAFPDNRPRVFGGERLVRINGMYRHGFLVAPALVAAAVHLLHGVAVPESTLPFLETA